MIENIPSDKKYVTDELDDVAVNRNRLNVDHENIKNKKIGNHLYLYTQS